MVPDQSEVLFRIAREACVNAVLHGHATRLAVVASNRDGGVGLEVTDDGVGIDPGALEAPSEHRGVRSMMARVHKHGGRLHIGRGSAQGTVVSAWLPLGPEPASRPDAVAGGADAAWRRATIAPCIDALSP